MPKLERQLSGVYFRYLNTTTWKYENRCFEDIDEEAQRVILDKATPEFLRGLALGLAETLNRIWDKFDISANPDL